MPSFLLAIAFAPALLFAAEPANDIPKLMQLSKEENATCEAAYRETEAAGGTLQNADDDEGRLFFADEGKTLLVAELFKKYPGGSKAGYEVSRKIKEAIETDKGAAEASLYIFELPFCRTIGFYKLGKALIESTRRFPMDAASRNTVRDGVLAFVGADKNEQIYLIDLMIRIALVEKLQEAKLIASEKIAPLRRRAEATSREVRRRNAKWEALSGAEAFRKLPEKDRREYAKQWVRELDETAKLMTDFKQVL